MQTPQTDEFRNEFRATEIGANYSGKLHFWFTTIWCLGLIITCILFVS